MSGGVTLNSMTIMAMTIIVMMRMTTMTFVYDPFEVIYPGARPGIVGIAFNGKSLCRFSFLVMMIMMMIMMMIIMMIMIIPKLDLFHME